jgi:hypothetical protein
VHKDGRALLLLPDRWVNISRLATDAMLHLLLPVIHCTPGGASGSLLKRQALAGAGGRGQGRGGSPAGGRGSTAGRGRGGRAGAAGGRDRDAMGGRYPERSRKPPELLQPDPLPVYRKKPPRREGEPEWIVIEDSEDEEGSQGDGFQGHGIRIKQEDAPGADEEQLGLGEQVELPVGDAMAPPADRLMDRPRAGAGARAGDARGNQPLVQGPRQEERHNGLPAQRLASSPMQQGEKESGGSGASTRLQGLRQVLNAGVPAHPAPEAAVASHHAPLSPVRPAAAAAAAAAAGLDASAGRFAPQQAFHQDPAREQPAGSAQQVRSRGGRNDKVASSLGRVARHSIATCTCDIICFPGGHLSLKKCALIITQALLSLTNLASAPKDTL